MCVERKRLYRAMAFRVSINRKKRRKDVKKTEGGHNFVCNSSEIKENEERRRGRKDEEDESMKTRLTFYVPHYKVRQMNTSVLYECLEERKRRGRR